MTGDTCQAALARVRWTADNSVVLDTIDSSRRRELLVSLIVVVGVFGTGVYDFVAGSAPGLFALSRPVGLTLFGFSCLATICAAALLARSPSSDPTPIRAVLIAASLLGSIFADPSYATLLLAVPLIEIRRRGHPRWRAPATSLLLLIVVFLVLAEDTSTARNEIETRLGLAIAFLMVTVLGDALREVDRRVRTEAHLAQLTERHRLAEDIHDSLGHHLLAASVQLETARALGASDGGALPQPVNAAVDNAAQAVAHAISETRLIVDFGRNRSVLDGEGTMIVEPSINELARLIVPDKTTMQIEVSGNHDSLPPATQVTIYRFVQEALTNLVRHSAASVASIRSTATDESVVIEVTDNGGGFDPGEVSRPGGLANMRRRIEALGGDFEVTSTTHGTALIARVPR